MKDYFPYITVVIIGIIISSIITVNAINKKCSEPKINYTNIKLDTVTMKSTDINRYLSYVPYGFNGVSDTTTLLTIDNDYLLSMALSLVPTTSKCSLREDLCHDYYEFKKMKEKNIVTGTYLNDNYGVYYTAKDNLNDILKDMYNMSIDDFNLSSSYKDIIGKNNGICYAYFDEGFSYKPCEMANELVRVIDHAQVYRDELYIYEYAVVNDFNHFKDLKNDTSFELDNDINVFDTKKVKEYGELYLEEHKDEFTQYKHTFKKTEAGYYWYKTEVVG